jgi:Domain of unknown function (DUF4145)
MLHAHGYKDKDLAKEVQQLLNETDPTKVLPRPVHETVDAIRNFGNFSAHPINDKTSLQVIDVEPHEAEWCLEILESLFEHFYVGAGGCCCEESGVRRQTQGGGKATVEVTAPLSRRRFHARLLLVLTACRNSRLSTPGTNPAGLLGDWPPSEQAKQAVDREQPTREAERERLINRGNGTRNGGGLQIDGEERHPRGASIGPDHRGRAAPSRTAVADEYHPRHQQRLLAWLRIGPKRPGVKLLTSTVSRSSEEGRQRGQSAERRGNRAGEAKLAPPLSRSLPLAEECMSQTWKQDKDGFSAQFITNWEDLVDLLACFQDGKWIYRGQSQDWPLKTSLERRLGAWGINLSSGPRVERQLIREFRRPIAGAGHHWDSRGYNARYRGGRRRELSASTAVMRRPESGGMFPRCSAANFACLWEPDQYVAIAS